ncbi:hypothetical protein AB0F73_30605 [Micromonospora purpureochromogenes]|uniref:hypothetical protein n=1 Tax=Micromonospora purpureochromogenes TaxID=47872 RepID=UPI0033CC0C6B
MPAATPLASGRDADVYALGADRVVRRNRDGGDVRAEAELMAYLRGQGYPVPEVFRADGPDLEMARLAGPVRLLDSAVSLRTRTGPLDPRRVAQAAARVRAAHG